MKIIIKVFKTTVLMAAVISLITTCALLDLEQDDNDDTDGPTHYDGAFNIDKEQVWEGTTSNKISEVYKEFDGERDISVCVYWPRRKNKKKE